jgi:putative transcriptional regulator
MPILVNLDVMMAKRKFTLTELCEEVGITLAAMSILKTGKARGIRFSTLSKLCTVLDCGPSDLLENVSDEHYRKLMGRDWVEP